MVLISAYYYRSTTQAREIFYRYAVIKLSSTSCLGCSDWLKNSNHDTYCTNLLPLSVQFGLLFGLVTHPSSEASSLPALTHLDPILKGSPGK